MSAVARLDVELVRRGLARSRRQAADLVTGGRVRVGGRTAGKPALGVAAHEPVQVDPGEQPAYVSRAGAKLAGALATFAGRGLTFTGRRALDAGASTGGFTDVLLRAGVREVIAVDVGHGQLVTALRADPRVQVHERTDVRDLDAAALGGPVDLAVADLSFISLRLVLPALCRYATADADHLLLVKPQFEVGRGRVGGRGVVRSPRLRAEAVRAVAAAGRDLGLGPAGVVASPMPGLRGNVEYVLWLRAGADEVSDADIDAAAGEGYG